MIYYLTLELKTEEKEAVEALALRQDLTVQQVIRQAIRSYQSQVYLQDSPCTALKLYEPHNED